MSTPISIDQAHEHLERLRASTPARLTPEEIEKYFDVHLRAERALDIDAVMTTVAPEAIYEIHPLGFVLLGLGAIREYYERSLARYMSRVNRSGYRLRTHGTNCIVLEVALDILQEDGSRRPSYRMGVIEFDGRGGVIAERSYLTDAQVQLVKGSLGDDFIDVPGVCLLAR